MSNNNRKKRFFENLSDDELGRLFVSIREECLENMENFTQILPYRKTDHKQFQKYSDEARCLEIVRGRYSNYKIRISLFPDKKEDYLLTDHDIMMKFQNPTGDYDGLSGTIHELIDAKGIEEGLTVLGYALKNSDFFTIRIERPKVKKRIRKKQLERFESVYQDIDSMLRDAYISR